LGSVRRVDFRPAVFTVVALPRIYGTPRVGSPLTGDSGDYLGVSTGAPGFAQQ
jgi:hypothetical protein